MPIDLEPNRFRGTLDVVGGVAVTVPKEDRRDFPGDLYVSHFASCPQAAEHRRKK